MKIKNPIGIVLAICLVGAIHSAKAQTAPVSASVGSSPFDSLTWTGDQPPTESDKQELLTIGTDTSDMEQFINTHPDSAWTPAMHNRLASVYRNRGRITLALNHWNTLWQQLKDSNNPAAQQEADHALAGQLELLTNLGRVETLYDLLKAAERRTITDPEDRRRIESAREGYMTMLRNPSLNYRCGTLVLAEIARLQGKPATTINALVEEPSPSQGISLLRLVQLSRQYGLGLVAVKRTDDTPLPVPCVVHWAQNHYGALLKYQPETDYYRVIFGNPTWMAAADVNAEASGYFLIPADQRPASWPVVSDAECAQVHGRSYIYSINDSNDKGCKVDPTAPNRKCTNCPTGMPAWSVSEPYINVWLADEPCDYTTSRGEQMGPRITIKQRDAPGTIYAYPYPGFLHSWYSRIYIQGMPSSVGETNAFASWTATVDLPTGGEVTYYSSSNWSSSYDEETRTTLQPSYGVLNDGTSYVVPGYPLGGTEAAPDASTFAEGDSSEEGYTNWNDGASGFRIFHVDGSVDRYGLIYWRTNTSAGYYDCEALLTQRTDPIGDDINLIYETYTNSGTILNRLHYVIDYDGKTNTFIYFTNNPGLAQQIVNPYGGTATFAYDGSGNLTNITDAVGNSSGFAWDTNGFVSTLNTPYGTTTFNYYDEDLSSTNDSTLSGDSGTVNRAVTVVDANGGTNIYVYSFNSSAIAAYEQFPSSVIPQGTPLGTLDTGTNEISHDYAAASWRNSYHWNPRQSASLSTAIVTNLTATDYMKARMQHWLGDSNNVSQTDLISVEQDPSPDGITPGQLTFYDYYGKTLSYLQGTNSQIAVVAHRQPSGNTDYVWSLYNDSGYVTKQISTYMQAGGTIQTRTNSYIYATNTISFVLENRMAGLPAGGPYYLNDGGNFVNSYSVQQPTVPLFAVYPSISNTCGAWSLTSSAGTSTVSSASILIASIDASGATNRYGGYAQASETTTAHTYTAWYNLYSCFCSDYLTESDPWQQSIIKTYTVPLPTRITNAVGYVTNFTYNSNNRLTSVTLPSGLTTTNKYDSIGLGFLTNTVDIQINRTNSFSYTNGLVYIHTDERGLSTTNFWDGLQRLLATYDSEGYISNVYTRLDLTASEDKLGNWTYYGYDPLRNLIAQTNANQGVNLADYCQCGELTWTRDCLSNFTFYNYDLDGRLTNVAYPDGYTVNNTFNSLNQLVQTSDGVVTINNTYDLQGLLTVAANAARMVCSNSYDIMDRPIGITDANGITVTNQFNAISELSTRTWSDGISESFGYSAAGLIAYTNRDQKVTLYDLDAIGRKTNEVYVGVTTNKFAYDSASDLLTLTDGLNHMTTWQYNQYGWLTNKVDGLGRNAFQFAYNASGWVTNRSTPAKGNTGYTYDNVGNVTAIIYPQSTINYSYNADNQLTNMVDAVGTTTYSYTPAGQMASETGPWANDAVNYTYSQELRTALNLSQPSGSWSQSYRYDSAGRMTNNVSPAGAFGYSYNFQPASSLVTKISLPNGASVTNGYDSLARLTQTSLNNYWGHILDGYSYGYDSLSLRTNVTRNLGLTTNSVTAGYDNIGQLTSWIAKESSGTPRLNEQIGFGFDAAGNLYSRTNEALVQTFMVDAANELTNVTRSGTFTLSGATPAPATNVTVNGQAAQTYGDFTFASTNNTLTNGINTFAINATNVYGVATNNNLTLNLPTSVSLSFDSNGNVTNDGTRTFGYDSENQLTNVAVAGQWQSAFVYDGKMLRRIERDYSWNSSSWLETNEIHFIYDGNVVIQERNSNNVVQVTYTRGNDLSGMLQEAAGIGGLLARTDTNGSTFYHSDGNGNITALMDGNENIVARYLYGPFGKLLGQWGSMANINTYRFSSKEWNNNASLYYYGRRYYDPNLQRWPNRDPIGERGGLNLYAYVNNNPLNWIDPLGLSGTLTIDSRSGGGSSGLISGDSGHGWITYTPDNGTTATYGTYQAGALGPDNPGGLQFNQELGQTPDASLSVYLNDAQEQALMNLINQYQQQGSGAWGYTHPCTTFANNAWNAGTGQNFNLGTLNLPITLTSDIQNFLNTPISVTTPPNFYNTVNTPNIFLPRANTPNVYLH